MKPYQIIPIIVVILFSGCNKQKDGQEANNYVKPADDGISIIRKLYKNSAIAVEYEIPVVKGTNIRHGTQKRFYLHGSVYSEIPYVAGKRNGIAYTYYPAAEKVKPAVWKEQAYVNDKLEGLCKRYHRDGTLQAEYEYKNGIPATGLKEYYPSGKPVKLPSLILSKGNAGVYYYVTARLSDNEKDVDYYVGDLIEGKYFHPGLKGLQIKNGVGEILLPLDTKKVTITAVMYTEYQNCYIVSKTVSF